MAHFAELESKTDPTGFTSDTHLIVKQVYVIDDEHESDGENWCKNFFSKPDGIYKQTSFNTYKGGHLKGGTAFRKNFAGIGFRYDSTLDAFIRPQPFASFTLNETTCLWEAPVTMPDDGAGYIWNETVYNNDNSKGWVRTSGE